MQHAPHQVSGRVTYQGRQNGVNEWDNSKGAIGTHMREKFEAKNKKSRQGLP